MLAISLRLAPAHLEDGEVPFHGAPFVASCSTISKASR